MKRTAPDGRADDIKKRGIFVSTTMIGERATGKMFHDGRKLSVEIR